MVYNLTVSQENTDYGKRFLIYLNDHLSIEVEFIVDREGNYQLGHYHLVDDSDPVLFANKELLKKYSELGNVQALEEWLCVWQDEFFYQEQDVCANQ